MQRLALGMRTMMRMKAAFVVAALTYFPLPTGSWCRLEEQGQRNNRCSVRIWSEIAESIKYEHWIWRLYGAWWYIVGYRHTCILLWGYFTARHGDLTTTANRGFFCKAFWSFWLWAADMRTKCARSICSWLGPNFNGCQSSEVFIRDEWWRLIPIYHHSEPLSGWVLAEQNAPQESVLGYKQDHPLH